MCYWDYLSILQTAELRNKRASGKSIYHDEVSQSSQDMIQREKDLNE